MAERIPDEVQGQLVRFQNALTKLEVLVSEQLSKAPKQLDRQLNPVQRSQMHMAVAQALHHTFLLYVRAQGQHTKDHPLNKETERLKFYAKKIRRLEAADYLSKHKPSMEVNIAAANRFISHALPDLSAEQRGALKEVGTKRKAADRPYGQDPAEMARMFLTETLRGQKGAKGPES